MKRFLALAIAALMIFSCAACSSDGNGDTTAAEGTTAADTVSDVIAAPANDDTTAPSETAAPAENGGNTASPAPADRNNNINIIIKPAGTAKPSAGGSSTVTPPKTDNTPVEVETDPKKIIVSAEKEWIFTEKITDSCHASTVLPLDDGSVIAAWFGGSSEKENDVNIYTSVRTEKDGWSKPIVVSAAAEIAHWNPGSVPEGRRHCRSLLQGRQGYRLLADLLCNLDRRQKLEHSQGACSRRQQRRQRARQEQAHKTQKRHCSRPRFDRDRRQMEGFCRHIDR